MVVADEIVEILARGSMSVKAFTFSGNKPDEKVSAEWMHVRLASYLWSPEADTIKLDVGPPRLGKAKRGRRPEPVTGDYKEALRPSFTKSVDWPSRGSVRPSRTGHAHHCGIQT